MTKPGKYLKILILDGEKNVFEKISRDLLSKGHLLSLAEEPAAAARQLEALPFDLVIVNKSVQHEKEIEALRAQNPSSSFIYLTQAGETGKRPGSFKEGVRDYALTHAEIGELLALVEKIALAKGEGSFHDSHSEALQKDKLAALGLLVSGVAHEINNPLTAVIGYTQLLMDGKGADSERYLSIISEQARRCSKIVQDMQIFSRKMKTLCVMTDPCEVAEQALRKMAGELQKRNVSVEKIYPVSQTRIFCDADQLRRVFENILLNAAHALEERKENRKVKIEVIQTSDRTVFSFADNGPGISPGNISRIFDPFFTTKDVGKGTGLGLSLSYGIVQAHQGEMTVRNAEGGGAVFRVDLPAAARKIPEDADRKKRGSAAGSNGKIKSILLVEDNEAVAAFLKSILMTHGYHITFAADGKSAYEALSRDSFDLTICDYRLPRMNGWELFEKLRAEKPLAAKKFIFISGSINFGDKEEEKLKENRLTYLPKPFTAEQLMAAIQEFSGF